MANKTLKGIATELNISIEACVEYLWSKGYAGPININQRLDTEVADMLRTDSTKIILDYLKRKSEVAERSKLRAEKLNAERNAIQYADSFILTHSSQIEKNCWDDFKGDELSKNYIIKKLILKKLRAAQKNLDLEKTYNYLHECQDQWHNVGPVPTIIIKELWEEFKGISLSIIHKYQRKQYEEYVPKYDKILIPIGTINIETIDSGMFNNINLTSTIIIDTNIFLIYPNIINVIGNKYSIVIPCIVIDEIDYNKKNKDPKIQQNAEKALININNALKKDNNVTSALYNRNFANDNLDSRGHDNKILCIALELTSKGKIVTLLTNDNGLQAKARSYNISTSGINIKDS